jgi:hypothetical protein
VVSVTDPYGRILGFLDRSPATFLSSSSSVVLMRLSAPRSRPTTCFLVVPGIEPGPPDLKPRTTEAVSSQIKNAPISTDSTKM